jgi:hypothetical protein
MQVIDLKMHWELKKIWIISNALPYPAKFLLMVCAVMISCRQTDKATLFQQLEANHTGIHFSNTITETDSVNPLDMDFLYHGGGVSAGDFNKDGMPDLYFTASQSSNKLYLNKGKLSFQDITKISATDGQQKWCSAAIIADINADSLDDIYVCASVHDDPAKRKNILYINQGINKEGIPAFKDMAESYGLADTGFSITGSFLDYDNDGDLDLYLVNSKNSRGQSMRFSSNDNTDTSTTDRDKLFRNDFDDRSGHPVFTDVSKEAGISQVGYGLGICVTDINKDGWSDIYVTNDYYTSDVLLVNNRDGTFTDRLRSYFKHGSQNAMGVDIADINNDALADMVVLDMDPESNYRKKKNMSGNNYFVYQNMLVTGTMLQYIRNTLQVNMGPRLLNKDSLSEPVFAEIGYYAGVAETDWSWSPSLADVDNDGLRDILITNGYPRDITDHDFWAFRQRAGKASKQEIIAEIPSIKIANYGFLNMGSCRFRNATKEWGLEEPSYSSGAICVDLDNDGDLEFVVNNINQKAFIYENRLNTKDLVTGPYLEIKFRGLSPNLSGIGARVTIFHNGKMQYYENNPVRGYLSMAEPEALFGIGNEKKIDSIRIEWHDKVQMLYNIPAKQSITVFEKNAIKKPASRESTPAGLFTDISSAAGINYISEETDWIDFNEERLLPHKFSEYGPAPASGDVDGNGYDDLVIGGSGDIPPVIFLQQKNGTFQKKIIPFPTGKDIRRPEYVGAALFDADKDGDLDLYLASGSNQFLRNTKNYQDRLFVNNGKADFIWDSTALPANFTSKSCVRIADIDRDGDEDLFIGGRVLPGSYPLPVSSFILRNDSDKKTIKFTDITETAAPELKNIGLVSDASWSDYDNDGWVDLLLAGEWMPVTVFNNRKGKLVDITKGTGIENEKGWWNSIKASDIDGDGDMDFVAGNLGWNSFYRASKMEPVRAYAKDFDGNGSIDAIPILYLPDQNGNRKPYPAQTRDDVLEQLPSLKKKFLTYKQFAEATVHDLFSPVELKDALVVEANNFSSSYLENLGGGKFRLHALPWQAQLAPVYGMIIQDVNGDGNKDLILCGNEFGTEVSKGRMDALNGLVLPGKQGKGFSVLSIAESGIFIPGNARGMVSLKAPDGKLLIAAVQHRGPIKLFKLNTGHVQ